MDKKPRLQSGPGWPRVTEMQALARVAVPAATYDPTGVAQVYATLALSEAIMTMSADVCGKLDSLFFNARTGATIGDTLDSIYAALSSLPGAS